MVRAVPLDSDDPALAAFLDFLERDLANHPERLQAVDAVLVERLQGLVGDVEIDINEALPDEDA
ncbi:type II toxin-antitoxin system PrlF family antitoxin [Halochromatium roseum]|uniref:type II toxin-antitoxin system PrlF family antitoxin n=1 Tax=Halochromatium roseum TaxID=391920 RepID=UPI001911559E|nr:type II toxin-antitoxin system PrlF family antitoxin [Halochromatium roseum]MBK5938354.1 regulator [Halochromatium roseum]